jgi:hypothetical protein
MTYELYCEWFLATYGRPFAATKAEFLAALQQPPTTLDVDFQSDFEFDSETERREGWGDQ